MRSNSTRCAATSRRAHSPDRRQAAVRGSAARKPAALAQGDFVLPTVFANAANDGRWAREEILGPVLVVIRWTDEAEAIRMANATQHYGLAAATFGMHRHWVGARRAAHSIERLGACQFRAWANTPGYSDGGIKQSGIGREYSFEGTVLQLHAEKERDREPQHPIALAIDDTLLPAL